MFNKRWLVLLCVLLSSGCFLFGPTYTKPRINIPKQWPAESIVTTHTAIHLPDLLWWKQFRSAELDGFIQKALQQSLEPQIAIANIEYARSQLDQVKLNWLPNLGVLAGFSQFPVLGNPGNIAIAVPLYVVNILQLYKQQKSAQANYEASIYAKDCVRLLVIAQTAANFFTLIAQTEALRLYQQLLKDYQAYLHLAKSQYRSGIKSQDNIDQVNSQIKQIHAKMDITQHNISLNQNALHFLFNENPGQIKATTSFKRLNSDAIIPGNLPASVLASRPDIQQAEALLRAANADVGAVTANLWPTITLGSYLGAGSYFKGPIKIWEAYMTMPVLDVPIFAQIKASKAQYKEVYLKYIATVRAALRDVANDLSAYSAYSHQLDAVTSAYKDEIRHCHLVESRYRHGLDDKVELIKCKIEVDQFELSINQNKLEKMIAMVNLYQDLAGGYHGI